MSQSCATCIHLIGLKRRVLGWSDKPYAGVCGHPSRTRNGKTTFRLATDGMWCSDFESHEERAVLDAARAEEEA